MSNPTSKTELTTAMQNGYTAFEKLLEQFNESQMTIPGVNNEWSIKDILTHLAAWQGRIASKLEAISAQGESSQTDLVDWTDADLERINAQIFLLNRERSLAEAWQDFRSTYQRIYAGTERLSAEDLFQPQRFSWANHPLWESIADNTFGHYAEHTPPIEAWAQTR